MIRKLLFAAGFVLAAFGCLFLLQGLGYVRWPASSFMIDQHVWVTRGSIVAAVGLALILIARRIRR